MGATSKAPEQHPLCGVGAHDEVYAYDDAGRRTGVYAKRRAELVSFARIWFRNLRAQGFLGEGARREVIE